MKMEHQLEETINNCAFYEGKFSEDGVRRTRQNVGDAVGPEAERLTKQTFLAASCASDCLTALSFNDEVEESVFLVALMAGIESNTLRMLPRLRA